MQTETPEYYLKRIYEASTKINPRFSLRSFATKLGLSSGGLTLILNGKRKLSLSRAHEICDALKLSPQEKDYFLHLVQLQSAKTDSHRSEIHEKIKTLFPEKDQVQDLSIENFRFISEWYGLAILEYLTVVSGTDSTATIAKKFGITKTDVELTIERLVKLELIEKSDSGYTRVANRLLVNSNTPNEAIRNYYSKVFEKSADSIYTQTPQEKVSGTEVFAFDPTQLNEVRKATDQYLNHLLKISRKGKNRTEIYQVVANCFNLTKQEKKK